MIIGIAGPAGSGKDTAADFLRDKGYHKLSFADPIRYMLQYGMGLQENLFADRALKEKRIAKIGKSPRELMQTLGTEWGRDLINPDLWVLLMAKRCKGLRKVVIPDVRMENEANFVRERGKLLHLVRDTSPVSTHSTELGVKFDAHDIKIDNTGSYERLKNAIQAAARY